ncbi:dephospho-CoA kinase [Thalassotalea aquiviva]|uniref:dephospho-CoA kinase n=1 Tax=Thalassotalea aquiviva TaxID=3242415 RepID=UPI00352B22D4
MSNLVIGLTGGIGSGKTTIANLFLPYGIDIIDADIIAREVVEPGSQALSAIAQHFGQSFIQANGELNRPKLRQRVFAKEEDKRWLNNLLHPLIGDKIRHACQQAKSPYCLLVAPLLIENGLNKSVDKVLVVDVSPQTQLKRTLARDQSSEQTVKNIIKAQVNRAERLRHADFVINNDQDTIAHLPQEVELLHRAFLKLIPL